jgi:hypothetical protein
MSNLPWFHRVINFPVLFDDLNQRQREQQRQTQHRQDLTQEEQELQRIQALDVSPDSSAASSSCKVGYVDDTEELDRIMGRTRHKRRAPPKAPKYTAPISTWKQLDTLEKPLLAEQTTQYQTIQTAIETDDINIVNLKNILDEKEAQYKELTKRNRILIQQLRQLNAQVKTATSEEHEIAKSIRSKKGSIFIDNKMSKIIDENAKYQTYIQNENLVNSLKSKWAEYNNVKLQNKGQGNTKNKLTGQNKLDTVTESFNDKGELENVTDYVTINQGAAYEIQKYTTISWINFFLFVTYFFMILILGYAFFKYAGTINLSIYYKIAIIFILIIYPFFISTAEMLIWRFCQNMYSDLKIQY